MPELLRLGDLIASFALSIPHAQARMDKEWAESRDQYLQALTQEAAQWQALAVMLAPGRQAIISSDLEAQFVFHGEQQETARLGLRLLNIGYERAFAHSDFVRQKLAIQVVAYSTMKERAHG